jgi:alanine transaminase
MELVGFEPAVRAELLKLASVNLCRSVGLTWPSMPAATCKPLSSSSSSSSVAAPLSMRSNVMGQIAVGLQCSPPQPGDASYERYCTERDAILASLQRRAQKLHAAFIRMEGVSCEPAQGALYLFPRIHLPAKAVAAAAAEGAPGGEGGGGAATCLHSSVPLSPSRAPPGKAPHSFYCLRLLDAPGIMVVPGTGFGQADGTFHFRSTILPSEHDLDDVIVR